MRGFILGGCVLLIAVLIVSPLSAQSRSTPSGGGDAGRGVASGTASTSTSSVSYSTGSGGSYASYSGGDVGRAFGGYSTSAPSVYFSMPRLDGTSFINASMYNYWSNYYSYLWTMYGIYPNYFTRFTRNYEPLMTPAMLRITLRDPLIMTKQMLKSVDELDAMLTDARQGKAVDKKALLEKSQQIRLFAKEIRQNRTLSIIDTSSKKMTLDTDDVNALDPAATAKLREMALDLNRQLTNLYSVSSLSTVSVDSYKEPSFESMAKAIDKLCKAIEASSKRL